MLLDDFRNFYGLEEEDLKKATYWLSQRNHDWKDLGRNTEDIRVKSAEQFLFWDVAIAATELADDSYLYSSPKIKGFYPLPSVNCFSKIPRHWGVGSAEAVLVAEDSTVTETSLGIFFRLPQFTATHIFINGVNTRTGEAIDETREEKKLWKQFPMTFSPRQNFYLPGSAIPGVGIESSCIHGYYEGKRQDVYRGRSGRNEGSMGVVKQFEFTRDQSLDVSSWVKPNDVQAFLTIDVFTRFYKGEPIEMGTPKSGLIRVSRGRGGDETIGMKMGVAAGSEMQQCFSDLPDRFQERADWYFHPDYNHLRIHVLSPEAYEFLFYAKGQRLSRGTPTPDELDLVRPAMSVDNWLSKVGYSTRTTRG